MPWSRRSGVSGTDPGLTAGGVPGRYDQYEGSATCTMRMQLQALKGETDVLQSELTIVQHVLPCSLGECPTC